MKGLRAYSRQMEMHGIDCSFDRGSGRAEFMLIFGLIAGLILSGSPSLIAGEPDSADQNPARSEPADAEKRLEMGGTLWASYGIRDRQSAFLEGSNGPENQGTGFRISRALVDLKARLAPDQPYSVRISPIAQSRVAQGGSTCRSQVNATLPEQCSGANDYYFGLYYAYADIPLSGSNLFVRLGQQQTPGVASPIHDLNAAMGHRFLDLMPYGRTGPSAAFENLGFTSATDLGASLVYSSDYGGIHLMLGNEGSSSVTGGQKIDLIAATTTAAKLDAAARGTGNSYGTDLHGLINYRPTGRSRSFSLDFSLPFTFKNVYGVRSSEVEYTAVDVTCAAGCNVNPRMQFIRGSRKAKEDVYYGLQVDGKVESGDWRLSAGGGPFFFLDRRGQSVMLTERELNPNDFFYINPANFSNPVFVQEMLGNNMRYERDSLGRALYFYGSIYYRRFGIFVQYTTGTGTGIDPSTGRMTGIVTAPSTIPWIVQTAQYELQYYGTTNNIPASALFLLRNNIDSGQARFQKLVGAILFQMSDSIRFGIVQSFIRAVAENGSAVRSNGLQNVYGFPVNGGTEGLNLAAQMDQSWLASKGYPVGLTVNDLIGRPRIESQTALSMEVHY